MTYNVGPMAERVPALVDYGTFQALPNALFRDYVAGSPRTAPFFPAGGWDFPAVERAADRTRDYAHPRQEMAEILVRQQRERGADAAAASAGRLADPGAVAIVTGQQPVLFGGPLYVLYKALAAIQIAARLEAQRGSPVLPVFWIASDDHDFTEIRQTTILDAAQQLRALRYSPREEPQGLPASSLRFDDTVTALVAELASSLPESPERDAWVETLARCYRPGVSFPAAFGAWLSALLPSLVLLDPADPAVKSLMVPVLRRELTEGSPSSRQSAALGARLTAAGYHEQVPVRDGFFNLFVVENGQRRALGRTESGIEVRGTEHRLTTAEAVHWLESEATAWSPNALLRPLVQDHLLPTAAYVGGPSEIAYHAQIGESYGAFGIPRPVVFPRPGVTLLETGPARALETERLEVVDLGADPEARLAQWAREANPGVEAAFVRARAAIDAEMNAVEAALAAVDPTLRAAADSARGRALHQVDGLEEKAMRALKKRDQVRADRLRRTRDALFPGGAPQERVLGLIGLVARHGEAAIALLRERIDPWARAHQVIPL
jgi:bacillithiol synthase